MGESACLFIRNGPYVGLATCSCQKSQRKYGVCLNRGEHHQRPGASIGVPTPFACNEPLSFISRWTLAGENNELVKTLEGEASMREEPGMSAYQLAIAFSNHLEAKQDWKEDERCQTGKRQDT